MIRGEGLAPYTGAVIQLPFMFVAAVLGCLGGRDNKTHSRPSYCEGVMKPRAGKARLRSREGAEPAVKGGCAGIDGGCVKGDSWMVEEGQDSKFGSLL